MAETKMAETKTTIMTEELKKQNKERQRENHKEAALRHYYKKKFGEKGKALYEMRKLIRETSKTQLQALS
jgi:DNA-binding protein Fis